jgi:nucleoside-diphosphate-sugar epimerase
MKTIVVTGGSGRAGRAVIRDLIDHGYRVMNVDLVAPREQLCHFMRADLTDLGQAIEAVRRAAGTIDRRRSPLGEADAVVHLAGIPAPSLAPDAATFQNPMPCSAPQPCSDCSGLCGPLAKRCSVCR